MSDRELLELAAKAAGLDGYVCEDWNGVYLCVPAKFNVPRSEPVFYRWLHDDGDALRLAVDLEIRLSVSGKQAVADWWLRPEMIDLDSECVLLCDDKYAAIRRVIVMAAAEIGKAMP